MEKTGKLLPLRGDIVRIWRKNRLGEGITLMHNSATVVFLTPKHIVVADGPEEYIYVLSQIVINFL